MRSISSETSAARSPIRLRCPLAEAISPSLVEVRDRFASRIQQAEELANDRLDDELSQKTERHVVKVDTNLRGREVEDREQLKAILSELEDRIGPYVDQHIRVRIV